MHKANSKQNKIISVVNDYAIFDEVVKNNKNLAGLEIKDYDNREENIPIPKRYNDFIEEKVAASTEDFWVIFIHQDFGFLNDINSILKRLDKNSIYGAIGATLYKGFFFGKGGFKKSVSVSWGSILQGNNDFNFKKYGNRVLFQKTVDTVDCCCVMIHSSLINKYGLRFDQNLNFHMYAEELCYRAKKDYKIKTKVIQINCYHLGMGKIDENFQNSVKYLKEKFKIKRIPSTCKN